MFLRQKSSNLLVITLTGFLLSNTLVPNLAFAEEILSDVLKAGQSRIGHAAAAQTQVNELATTTDDLKNNIFAFMNLKLSGLLFQHHSDKKVL